jgi:glycosyltransferase involved in cell wall biosynthesis
VLTIHDVWPLRLPVGLSWLKGRLYRASLAHARGARFIVTSSRFSQREIATLLRLPIDRVRAIRLGVPPPIAEAEPRRPASMPDGTFALVVGDNRPRKNLDMLARAWASFGARPPLGLVSAGPVDGRFSSLAQFATEAGAAGVASLGWVEEPELAWLYRNAALVLFPSQYEGFGFPLVEAFVRGVPTVAADIPVLREIGEGAAQFVDPDRSEAWARETSRLMSDPDERARMAAAGRARAAELQYRTTARETLALLREAAGLE